MILPDFALDSAVGSLPELSPEADSLQVLSNDPSHNAESRTRMNSQPTVVPDLNLDINDSAISDSDYESGDIGACQPNSTGGLPDFLPDFLPGTAMTGSGARPKVTHMPQINGHLQTERFDKGDGLCSSACIQQVG